MNRSKNNPIITRDQIPSIPPHLVDVSSVFNPGAVRYDGKILLMLRVQNRARETYLLMAESKDGVRFYIRDEPVRFDGIESLTGPVYHIYDPRITQIDERFYVMFAIDMEGTCELGLALTFDFETFTFIQVVSSGDVRNGVLFPHQIGGRYLRLDRPNRVKTGGGPATGDRIMLSESNDLLEWRTVAPVISGRWHYWDEVIGPGPPPIKTRAGWLQIYHGVAHHLGTGLYQAGVMLLDLDHPYKVLARGRYNILEPRELYELTGQVPNVVFPSGAVVAARDAEGYALPESRVFVYYGAADTSICLATTTIDELVAHARAT